MNLAALTCLNLKTLGVIDQPRLDTCLPKPGNLAMAGGVNASYFRGPVPCTLRYRRFLTVIKLELLRFAAHLLRDEFSWISISEIMIYDSVIVGRHFEELGSLLLRNPKLAIEIPCSSTSIR